MISAAIFLSDCNTVHEYKDKIKALSKHGKAFMENRLQDYEIAECFAMKYEDFIYLCNHINERFAIVNKVRGGASVLKTTMFFVAEQIKCCCYLLVETRWPFLIMQAQRWGSPVVSQG